MEKNSGFKLVLERVESIDAANCFRRKKFIRQLSDKNEYLKA